MDKQLKGTKERGEVFHHHPLIRKIINYTNPFVGTKFWSSAGLTWTWDQKSFQLKIIVPILLDVINL